MTVLVAVLAVAVLAGRLSGGSLDRLTGMPLRRTRLLAVAAVSTLVGATGGPFGVPTTRSVYVGTAVISAAFAAAFLTHNAGAAGIPLVAAGFALNAVVILSNGAMPVSVHAAERARVDIDAARSGRDAKHEPADRRTRLRVLGDVVPVPLPGPLRAGSDVLSPGDVLLAAGLAQLVVLGMRRGAAAARPVARTDAQTAAPGDLLVDRPTG